MSRFSLQLFDTFQLEVDDRPITAVYSDKIRLLLAYLCTEANQAHSRQKLATLLWSEQSETKARTNLRNNLVHLRRILKPLLDSNLNPPLFTFNRQTLQFHYQTNHAWVDVLAFKAALTIAETHHHAALIACDSCCQQLVEAVALYQGDFLTTLTVKDSLLLEEWRRQKQEQFHQQILWACQQLADYYQKQGSYELAARYARRQLRLEAWREVAHRQLMLALAGADQKTAALQQYELCRQVLADELGIEPMAATQRLYHQIKAGDAPWQPGQISHNLPRQATSFVGREEDVVYLQTLLEIPENNLITIVGPGGMGKTRLALACAEQQLTADSPFPHGIFFINLAPLNEAEQIASALADALNFPLQGGDGRSSQQQLLDYLRSKKMLLLLDNFEHLLDGADLLNAILQAAPEVQLLVTSRERLHLRAEQVYPIEGLTFPDGEDEDAGAYTAVQLFLQSARRHQPDFTLSHDDDLPCLVRICRTVAGMPLALELVASWVDMLPLAEIAVELRQGLDFLETNLRDMPERHRSIRAAIDHSWQKLSAKEQEIFAQFSVFRGGFTRQAAQGVIGASLHLLAQLNNKFFLQYDQAHNRYQIHELLRQYGAEKLAANPKSEEHTRNQHGIYYCTGLGQLAPDLRGPRQQATIAQIEADNDNVRVAWYWAAQQKHWEQLDMAVNGLSWFYLIRGRYEEGAAACRQAAANLNVTLAQETATAMPRVLAQIWVWQANFAWILGDKATGTALLQESLTLLDRQSEHDQATQLVKAHALLILGLFSDYYDSDLETARQTMAQSLAIYQAVGDQWGEAWCLRYLGNTLQNLNFKDEARISLENSLTLFKAIGDKVEIAMSLQFLGCMAIVEGQYQQAEQLSQESLVINEEVRSSFGRAQALNILAWVAMSQGQLTQADSYFEKVLAISHDMGDIFNRYPAIIGQSCIQLHKGEYEQAHILAQKAIALRRSKDILDRYFLSALGDVALALGEYNVARRYLQENVDILISGEQCFLIEARGVLGVTLLKLGYPEQARQQFYEALQLALHTHSNSLPFLLADIAVFLGERGDQERAVALYALAESHPLIAISRWFADVYGRSIAMAESALPPNIAKKAKAQGWTLDWWETAQSLLTELAELGWGKDAEEQRSSGAEEKGRFVQEALLATGGFGEVYQGRDTETGQVVVIKRLKPELVAQQPDAVARFVREGELLRQLNHPNIVQMIASQEIEGEQCLIMEYVAGGSLRDLLNKEGQLSVTQTADIALELADALSRAHHLDIIHRDLKPGNVLLAEDGTPRLTDFGVARMMQREGTHLTQAGAMVGTVHYMSPEACRGEVLDSRADIWSFGILLYEMLTGTLPFQHDHITTTIFAILSEPTPDLLALQPDVPAALVRLIEGMLVKERAGRSGRMRQVAAKLDRIRTGL